MQMWAQAMTRAKTQALEMARIFERQMVTGFHSEYLALDLHLTRSRRQTSDLPTSMAEDPRAGKRLVPVV